MSEPTGVIVHCPRCGDALMATPLVCKSYVDARFVSVEFSDVRLDHTCEVAS